MWVDEDDGVGHILLLWGRAWICLPRKPLIQCVCAARGRTLDEGSLQYEVVLSAPRSRAPSSTPATLDNVCIMACAMCSTSGAGAMCFAFGAGAMCTTSGAGAMYFTTGAGARCSTSGAGAMCSTSGAGARCSTPWRWRDGAPLLALVRCTPPSGSGARCSTFWRGRDVLHLWRGRDVLHHWR